MTLHRMKRKTKRKRVRAMNEKINGDFSYCSVRKSGSDVSGEYILPDSFPDVRNLLYVGASVGEIKKYFSANEAELSGKLTYRVLFTCMRDGTESLESVCFEDDFKTSVKCDMNESGSTCVSLRSGGASGRMANPRKFALRCALELTLCEEKTQSALVDVNPDDETAQVRCRKLDVLSASSAELYEHSFSDNAELDVNMPEIEKLVFSEALLNIDNSGEGEAFRLGGTLALCCVYADKEGNYHGINRDIPYTVTLNDDELELIGDTGDIVSVIAEPAVTAFNIEVGKNRYDESKQLEIDVDYDIDLLILRKKGISVITDAYDTAHNDNPKYEKLELEVPCGRLKNNFTYTESCNFADGELIGCFGVALTSPAIVHSEGNTAVESRLSAALIFTDNEGIHSRALTLPTAFRLGGSEYADKEAVGSAIPKKLRMRADSGKLYAECEVCFDAAAVKSEKLDCCRKLEVGSELGEAEKSILSVFYPTGGETLWDAAKAMRVPLASIIGADAENGVDSLLVKPVISER